MNHRRLRLPAATAVLAIAAPVLAADPVDAGHATPVAGIQRDARELRDTVHQNSVEFGHQVAHGFHQARHEFTLSMHQAGHAIHHWWDSARESISRI